MALSRTSIDPATPEEVAAALRTGTFPDGMSPAKGAILQAAAFAHELLAAGRKAAPTGASVVWEFTGGRCSYRYP